MRAALPDTSPRDRRVSVVIATRDRRQSLLATLDRLRSLPERPAVVVVDNGSADGTPEAVRRGHPDVNVLDLGRNEGAAARNLAARQVATPYVAFADDDSWWEPGALVRAADVLDAHPRLGLLAARVLVGEDGRLDPVCAAMAASRVPGPAGLPGPPVLGFVACGAVVRRDALLAAGGFHPRYGVGGEEQLLAIDLCAAGWDLAYVADVVARHHPSPARDPGGRRRVAVRNDLWSAWLRRPLGSALAVTGRLAGRATSDRSARRGVLDAVGGLPWVARERRVVPADLEHRIRLRDT